MGDATSVHKRQLVDKAVNTLICKVDAKNCEKLCTLTKFPEHSEWIDINARNTFHKGVGAGTLKCVVGFNDCG